MEPRPDDIADTMSASYRTMKELSAQMQDMFNLVLYLEISIALLVGAFAFYILHKAMSE